MHNIFLSIVIPTYNEEQNISNSLSILFNFLKPKNFKYEVIISDDGSNDRTVEKAAESTYMSDRLRILQGTHLGKGGAVKRGVLAAQGEYILFMDADLSTPVQELDKLLKLLQEGAEIAIGSRALPASQIKSHQPWWRERLGRMFNRLVQFFILKGIKDTQCGFKLFKRKAALDIFTRAKITGFSFDVEILYLAQKLGCSIKEAPVAWINRAETKVSVPRELLTVFIDLMRIRIIH